MSAYARRSNKDQRSLEVGLRIVERHLLIWRGLTAAPLQGRVVSFPFVGFLGAKQGGSAGFSAETFRIYKLWYGNCSSLAGKVFEFQSPSWRHLLLFSGLLDPLLSLEIHPVLL